MQLFIDWCGFIGSWLLVAGPVYQAALELREEKVERDHLEATRKKLPPQPRTSPWWWLLPPIKVWLERRRNEGYREAFLIALPDEDVQKMVSLLNKASAWLYVAGGGLLLAMNETYTLTRALHVGLVIFWLVVILFALACVGNTAYRIANSERVITKTTKK